MQRKIKECYKCGYSLVENINIKEPLECIATVTNCPKCNEEAVHFLYVDEHNVQRVSDEIK